MSVVGAELRLPGGYSQEMLDPHLAEPDVERFRSALRRLPARQGRFEQALRLVMRAWCWAVGWRIDIGPTDGLPAVTSARPGSGCVVACAPHRAWLEPFLLVAAWPPEAARLVWLADGRTVTRSWWRRRLLPRLGVIPIEVALGGPRRYAEAVAEVLAAGAAVAVFPEKGPPSPPHRSRTISPGFAYLARRAGAPIIPVVMAGTHAIVRGSTFSVRFLDAIQPGAADLESFRRESRRLAHELADGFAVAVNAELPALNELTDARRPVRERWRWLARLFH